MRITVLNGSPKGAKSVTMQYVEWLKIRNPEHSFITINVAQKAATSRGLDEALDTFAKECAETELVLFAFPLYYLLVHGNYKRFIERLFERRNSLVLSGKYAASLSTSINFYDHTAHNYIRGIAEDLGMRFAGSFSANMDDLKKKSNRMKLASFFDLVVAATASKRQVPRANAEFTKHPLLYQPAPVVQKVDTKGKSVCVISDVTAEDRNLHSMIDRFRDSFSAPITVVNLHDVDIKGGCLGCIHCGQDNRCAWDGKDGFIEFYRSHVMTADILILAGTIRDRYLSSLWKTFMDRSFFLTHQPKLNGRQAGFLIAGPLQQIANLRELLTAQIECNDTNLVDFVTDEAESSAELDAAISGFAQSAVDQALAGYIQPKTFRGIAGIKLFRDEMFSNLRFAFSADHRFYRKHGYYDFPNRKYWLVCANNLLIFAARVVPGFKAWFQKKTIDGMLMPFKPLLEKARMESR
jgi:multimeric flavodoxin WrbA